MSRIRPARQSKGLAYLCRPRQSTISRRQDAAHRCCAEYDEVAKFCELVCARDFDSALFLVGSHHRIATLRSIWRRVARAQQASVLADAISSSDFLAPHLVFLILALRSIRARGERLFDGAAAREQFALLQDRITAYRGAVQAEVDAVADGRSFYGINWTLNRERAIWFTTSRTRNWRSPPVLLTVSVARDDVAGHLVDRNEADAFARASISSDSGIGQSVRNKHAA